MGQIICNDPVLCGSPRSPPEAALTGILVPYVTSSPISPVPDSDPSDFHFLSSPYKYFRSCFAPADISERSLLCWIIVDYYWTASRYLNLAACLCYPLLCYTDYCYPVCCLP
ncbi:hypothetical protein M9458_006808 [Cirrhinus mrigala]|uniref:Uncharacterized protein n=1 Tax=Cirrhinus mrigala TaxID=683832 RepID=A0ABD0RIR1_CIRMR